MAFIKRILAFILIFTFIFNIALADVLMFNGTYSGPDVEESPEVDDSYFSDSVFIGDSLTVSIESRNLFSNANFIANIGASILGATEDRIFQYKGDKKKMSELLDIYKPAKIYILIGTNTLCFTMSEDAIDHYNKMLDLIASTCPDSIVYLLAVPTVREFTLKKKYPGATNKRFLAYNKRLKEIAEERHAYFLDTSSIFYTSEKEVQPKREYIAGDGLHLSMDGAKLFKEYLQTHTVTEYLVN